MNVIYCIPMTSLIVAPFQGAVFFSSPFPGFAPFRRSPEAILCPAPLERLRACGAWLSVALPLGHGNGWLLELLELLEILVYC